MQIIPHDNRAALGKRQPVARRSGNRITFDDNSPADYTITKFRDSSIKPQLPRARKHLGFILVEKRSRFDPDARISRTRKDLVLAILVGFQSRHCVVAAPFEESSEKESMLERLCIFGNIRTSFIHV